MQGGAKPPGPLAFEPIDPQKRQISRQPPPATEPALWGWSIGNRGGGHLCTYKLGSDYELADGGSGRRSADSTIFAASGSPVSRPCAPASLPRQVRTLGEHLMHGLRYRILAGTALALILAVPMVGLAQGPNKMAPAPHALPPPVSFLCRATPTPGPRPRRGRAGGARPPPAPRARRACGAGLNPSACRRPGGHDGAARPGRSSGIARSRR